MKNKFLLTLKNASDINQFISRFMDIKENIGNGVGAGKLFERLFVDFINQNAVAKANNIHALHLNLSNSTFIWDIIISDKSDIKTKKEEIIEIIRTGSTPVESITDLIGENWLGISLKTYKDDACQITTDYSYRTFLDENVGKEIANESILENFNQLLNKHDNQRFLILALNTYDKRGKIETNLQKIRTQLKVAKTEKKVNSLKKRTSDLESELIGLKNTWSLRLLSFDKKFDKITYKKNKKLSQYDLSINGVNYFKVLYGKNQANPFQRGIWTHNNNSIEYFDLITQGQYEVDGFFERIISQSIFN